MPVISIGTGGTESKNCTAIVKNWMSLGGRGVDTAFIYRDQAVVAKAIADSGVARKDVFITTKIPGCMFTEQTLDSDLKQLGTDYIDLVLIHFPKGDCRSAWRVLEKYHQKGVLKAIGVSNFKRSDLKSILDIATVVPAVNQIQHNVLSHDDDTISFSAAHNITIEAFSPLGRDSGEIPNNKVIQSIAAAHNVSTYQIAMKWILQHGHILTFQSSSEAHQAMDADVFGFTLSNDEMSELDQIQNGRSIVV